MPKLHPHPTKIVFLAPGQAGGVSGEYGPHSVRQMHAEVCTGPASRVGAFWAETSRVLDTWSMVQKGSHGPSSWPLSLGPQPHLLESLQLSGLPLPFL